jgi:hypothetical protein
VLTHHFVLLRRELCAPLRVGLLNYVHGGEFV